MSEVREMKRVEDSETEQSHLLFPRSLNDCRTGGKAACSV